MLVADPTRLASWTFDLTERDGPRSPKGEPVGQVKLLPRDAAEITIGTVPFGMGSDRSRRHFVLTFEGVEVAQAQQPSALQRRLRVLVNGAMLDARHASASATDVPLVLQAQSPFQRAFDVLEAGRSVGRIRPLGLFSRRTEIVLPASLPPAVQAFLFALVVVQWRRAQQSG